MNAKLCPENPLAITDISIEDGPTSGIMRMFFFCASATMSAPGSATAGHPASLITPIGFPSFIIGSR